MYAAVMNYSQKRTVPFFLQVKTIVLLTGMVALLRTISINAQPIGTDLLPWRDTIVIGGEDGLHPDSLPHRYRIKLAVSGGGARGLAAVGVIQAIEEAGIEIVAIAGTSIGAVVGGLYASGYSAPALDSIMRQTDFSDLFSNQPDRESILFTRRNDRDRHLLSLRFDGLTPRLPTGLTSAQRVSGMLSSLTNTATYQANSDFDKLPIPFRAVTTDVVSGSLHVIKSGSLADAIRGAIAFPLAFTAIEQGDLLLMDGGMLAPLPVDVARSMGDTAAMVVAIDVTSPLLKKEAIVTPIDLINQVSSIMTADKLAVQRGRADLIVSPALGTISASSFGLIDTILAIGRIAGKQAVEPIKQALERTSHDSLRYQIISVSVDSQLPGSDRSAARAFPDICTRLELIHALQNWYKANGLYRLEAIVSPAVLEAQAPQGAAYPVHVTLRGERALHRDELLISIEGNLAFDDMEIIRAAALANCPLDAAAMRTALRNIKQLYAAAGFDLAYVRKAAFDLLAQRLTITIDEGTIRDLPVTDNDRSRDWLVRSYVPLQKGRPFSSRKATIGVNNLFGTDFFDRVSIDPIAGPEGAIARIAVREKAFTQVRLGWHWDDEYQSEQYAELLDDNLFGVGLQAIAHIRYAKDRQHYETALRLDRIFLTYLTAQARAYHDRLDRNRFDSFQRLDGQRHEERTGFEFKLGQQVRTLGVLSAGVQFEEVRFQEGEPVISSRFGLRKLLIESLVDNLDRLNFPTTGRRSELQLQVAGKILGGREEFTRFRGMLEAYFPVAPGLVLHPSFSIGLSRRGLPPTEQFYLGGMKSFYGYRSEQLVGDKFLLMQAELRFRLPLRFYLSTRYDLGEVYRRTDQIKFTNLRDGVGAQIAFDSPIGPFEFGYGLTENAADRFYFRAGLQF